MALKSATKPTAPLDEDDEVPVGIPRHAGNGRPKIRHADDPTKMSYWPRASSFAERVESTFLLDRHGERLVARGMALSPDLCDLAASVGGAEERGDKDELTRVAGLAKTAAGGDRRANRGTALHKLRERRDRGEDLAFVPPKLWAALQAYCELMEPFVVHGSEQFVVNDRWGVAGSYDVLLGLKPGHELVAPDGEIFTDDARLGGDLKSGEHIDELGRVERAVQQAVYFCGGRPYVHVSDDDVQIGADGRGNWPEQIWPSRTWSLIPHVPLEHPEDAALWWVDLTKASAIADQVAVLHELRKTEGLIVAAEPPRRVESAAEREQVELWRTCSDCNYDTHVCMGCGEPVTHEQGKDCGGHLLDHIAYAEDEDELTQLWERFEADWTDEHTAAVRARLAQLSA